MTIDRRRGSVLLLVLVVIAMLTLGTATYLELMQNERRAVRHHGRGVQATRLAESGVEYVKTLLARTPQDLQAAGGLTTNPTLMQAIVVDDQPDPFDRGRISIVAPAMIDGLYVGHRFGLENESAKLNVNTLLAPGAEEQAQARLLAMPGMTPEIADAILDWLDPDDEPRQYGAELEIYNQLAPPYEPRNGPIADLDELLMVRGVTPELLYGLDQNRNYIVDPTELPRGLMAEIDNADGSMNRGWSAYLTVNSVENMQAQAATPKLDLNSADLQQLYTDLQTALGEDGAKFIIAYRQFGGQPINQEGEGGAGQAGAANQAGGAGGANRAGTTSGIDQADEVEAEGDNENEDEGGRGGGGGGQGGQGGQGGGQNQTPVEVEASALQLNFEQEGGNQINSPLDLVAVRVQVPGQENNPPQNVNSPWMDDANSYRELMKVYDAASFGTARRVAGRVNINVATRPVLRSIPGLPESAVGSIVGRREADPDPALSVQRHPLWLLSEGIVTLEEMKQLERYVTTRGDAYGGQVVGFFDAGPSAARGEFVVDRSGTTPHLRLWRDLSSLGRGFTTLVLGVDSAAATTP